MLTTDISLRFDLVCETISRRFVQSPAQLADAFVRA
jgi:catalase-peroxidase